jgi:hypothetical protein
MKNHVVVSVTLIALLGCGSISPFSRRAAVAAPAIVGAVPTPPAPPTPVGYPDVTSLARARLVEQSCADGEKAVSEQVKQRIAQMRKEVDEAFENWRSQPLCPWLMPGVVRLGPNSWRVYGAGGLTLSGIGEGGGGSGEGIGLGTIETIGHGAGTGTAYGFGTARASSASRTNNQIDGVDEADFVKNDGAYVYVVANGVLRIVEAMNPRVVSATRLPGNVRKMFVEGDRVVVYLSSGSTRHNECNYGYDCVFVGDGTRTTILVMNVGDRTRPVITRRIELSGSLMAARRIGNAVHTVVADNDPLEPMYEVWPSNLPWCHENEPVVRAQFALLKRQNEQKIRQTAVAFPTISDRGRERKLCNVLHTPAADGNAFTSLVSFDMHDDKAPVTTSTVQSRPGAVFASDRGLYVTVVNQRRSEWNGLYDSRGEMSHVHKFRIGPSAAETRYVGSGVVPGHVLNQFAMDENAGYLRVATTLGRVPDPYVMSSVSILKEVEGGNLVRAGGVYGIAPSEDIRAVRFDGDRAYVVTFKKTDPLFVLDLHDPAAPRILGELKIPGFSTYLHRIDPNHLLSIGFDANDHGDFAFFDGVLLQIFDVTKPTEPRLLHREKIGTRGSSSEAATDHLAFNYLGDRNLLAIPTTLCDGGGDGSFGNKMSFSGLLVYRADVAHGFRRIGGIDHGKHGADCHQWWSNATSHVKRSIFLDDLVYSIALDRMKVQRLSRLGADVADIPM